MSTIHQSRMLILSIAAVLIGALSAPIAVTAQDEVLTAEQVLAAAPAPPSWDETSGYAAVEATRAEVSALVSGEANGSQDQVLAIAAAATSWDATSGYGSVEASRAANALAALPVAVTTQVPSDVR